MTLNPHLRSLALIALVAGCDGSTKLPGDGPQESYCEALCNWAVDCAAAERDVDQEALLADCLESARAADPSCADAEAGDLDPASSAALTECTDAVDEAATSGECGAFTGSLDEQATATPPAECASEGTDANETFDDVQDSTEETNDQLCDRFSVSFCDQLQDCLLGALGVTEIPQELIDAAGGTPTDLCVAQVAPITDKCKSDELYQPEKDIKDVNTAREAARECLADLAEVNCDELLAGNLPKTCAGAFTSTKDAATFAEALYGIAGEFLKK